MDEAGGSGAVVGPKGWTAKVHEMDVRPGGVWRYSMRPASGDGEEVWGKAAYRAVVKQALLSYVDAFTDGDGRISEGTEMPTEVETSGGRAISSTLPRARIPSSAPG